MARRQKMPVCACFVQDPSTKSTDSPAIDVMYQEYARGTQ